MEVESIVARTLQILLALGGAYLIATWFVLAVWTFRDIEARSRNIVTQVFSTLLAVFFWIPGVLLYMILRPKETLDEAYQRSLEEEYLLQDLQELPLCPTCNHFVHDDWQLCPHCNTQLRDHCHSCGHLVDLRWEICPYCGAEQGEHEHAAQPPAARRPERDWVDPAAIARRLREEGGAAPTATQALPAASNAERDAIAAAARIQSLRNLHTVTLPDGEQDDQEQHAGDNTQGSAEENGSSDKEKEPVSVPRRFRI